MFARKLRYICFAGGRDLRKDNAGSGAGQGDNKGDKMVVEILALIGFIATIMLVSFVYGMIFEDNSFQASLLSVLTGFIIGCLMAGYKVLFF